MVPCTQPNCSHMYSLTSSPVYFARGSAFSNGARSRPMPQPASRMRLTGSPMWSQYAAISSARARISALETAAVFESR